MVDVCIQYGVVDISTSGKGKLLAGRMSLLVDKYLQIASLSALLIYVITVHDLSS
jgi:hypothetical protein